MSDQHKYISTYCIHDDHAKCRLQCKTCEAPCLCSCHRVGMEQSELVEELAQSIWRLMALATEDDATEDLFTARNWKVLHIEKEREEFRKLARQCLQIAKTKAGDK